MADKDQEPIYKPASYEDIMDAADQNPTMLDGKPHDHPCNEGSKAGRENSGVSPEDQALLDVMLNIRRRIDWDSMEDSEKDLWEPSEDKTKLSGEGFKTEILTMSLEDSAIKNFMERYPDVIPKCSQTSISLVKNALEAIRDSLNRPQCDRFWKDMETPEQAATRHYPGIVAALRRCIVRSPKHVADEFKALRMTGVAIRVFYQINLPQYVDAPLQIQSDAVTLIKNEMIEDEQEAIALQEKKDKKRRDFAEICRAYNKARQHDKSPAAAMAKVQQLIDRQAEADKLAEEVAQDAGKTKSNVTHNVVPVMSPTPSTVSISTNTTADPMDMVLESLKNKNSQQMDIAFRPAPPKQQTRRDSSATKAKEDDINQKLTEWRTPTNRSQSRMPGSDRRSTLSNGKHSSTAKKSVQFDRRSEESPSRGRSRSRRPVRRMSGPPTPIPIKYQSPKWRAGNFESSPQGHNVKRYPEAAYQVLREDELQGQQARERSSAPSPRDANTVDLEGETDWAAMVKDYKKVSLGSPSKRRIVSNGSTSTSPVKKVKSPMKPSPMKVKGGSLRYKQPPSAPEIHR